MMEHRMGTTRRTFVRAALATAAAAGCCPSRCPPSRPRPRAVRSPRPARKFRSSDWGPGSPSMSATIPCSGTNAPLVMAAFFEAGGRMINSSPMYGSSQPVIGYGLQKLGRPSALFSAEKVWTSSAASAPPRSSNRAASGGAEVRPRSGSQPPYLEAASADALPDEGGGPVRYVGITTSEGRRHDFSNRSCGASRSISCSSLQRRRSRSGGAAAAAGVGARPCRDRQPAVPAGRADRPAQAPEAARMGGRSSGCRAGRNSC